MSDFFKKYAPLGGISRSERNPLTVMIGAEVLGVSLMMAGIAPRELAFFILGGLSFFIIFAPLKQATLLALFSIPLYTALPIEAFDSFAVWRVVVGILFLRVVWGGLRELGVSPSGIILAPPARGSEARAVLPPSGDHAKTASKSAGGKTYKFSLSRLGVFVSAFFVLGLLSLLVAQEPIFGIRKLIYLANIFALFFVVRAVVKNRDDFLDALKYLFAGSVFALAVAYVQFITILFVPLYVFWQWWAGNVIPVFYGANLGELLSFSNTWFSYYKEAEATLRVFSTFPDSHSFALFMVLSLPIALTLFVLSKIKIQKIFFGATIILILLAIILSGTRGVWVGALPVFLIVGILFLRSLRGRAGSFLSGIILAPPARGSEARAVLPPSGDHAKTALKSAGEKTPSPPPLSFYANILTPSSIVKRIINTTLIVFFLFALLFPVASQLLRFSQIRQSGQVSETTTMERFSTSFNIRELSNKGRIEIWLSTLRSISERPMLGVGIGNYPVVLNENVSSTRGGASAHSLYMDVASEMGILAGIVLILIFFEILRQAIKNLFNSDDAVFAAFGGFFAVYLLWLMAYSVVDVVLLNDKVLLLFTALATFLYVAPGITKNSKK